jgi:hypothetical protein
MFWDLYEKFQLKKYRSAISITKKKEDVSGKKFNNTSKTAEIVYRFDTENMAGLLASTITSLDFVSLISSIIYKFWIKRKWYLVLS